jgi:hypothetical protein
VRSKFCFDFFQNCFLVVAFAKVSVVVVLKSCFVWFCVYVARVMCALQEVHRLCASNIATLENKVF